MSSIESSTAPASISPAQRVVAAFVAPTALFADLRRNSSWWPAFLLLIVSGLVFTIAVQKQVGWSRAYDAVLHQSAKQEAQFAQMQPAQAAQAKAVGAKLTAATAWGFSLIILVSTAVSAVVLLGTLNFAFGAQTRFSQLFAVYMYAMLPTALHSLLAAIALFAGLDSGSFLITNPVGSNIGYYLSSDLPKWLLAIATSFDLFTLWTLALLVIGCQVVARVSRSSAAVAVLGWWSLLVALKVGTAAWQG